MPADVPLTVAAYVFLVGVAVCRGSATYALGRWVRHAGEGSRWHPLLERPLVRRGERWVSRLGAPAVSLSFLTVGVQSAVNLSAGFLRMPLVRYLPAVTVGALAWAGIYLGVGVAFLRAWSASSVGPAVVLPLLLVAVVVAVAMLLRRRFVAQAA